MPGLKSLALVSALAFGLTAPIAAHAATVCPGGGTCTGTNSTLFGPSPSSIPAELDDQKIFLNGQTNTTSFTGQVGSQTGSPTVDFTTNAAVDAKQGFATGITSSSGGTDLHSLTITIPGFTFSDFLFDSQLANTSSLNLTVEAFSGATLLDSFQAADLQHNQDESWKILANSGITMTSLTLLSTAPGAFNELKHFQVSGLSEVPVPAALPLFAGGLGVLGAFGWRKRKKSAAAAA